MGIAWNQALITHFHEVGTYFSNKCNFQMKNTCDVMMNPDPAWYQDAFQTSGNPRAKKYVPDEI